MVSLLAEASSASLAILGAVAAFTAFVMGTISNAILKDAGFGIVGNGILVVLGAGSGVWAEFLVSGRV